MGDDCISRMRALGSRRASGGEDWRTGEDDSGEETEGRCAEGDALLSSRKTGRGITENMAAGEIVGELDLVRRSGD